MIRITSTLLLFLATSITFQVVQASTCPATSVIENPCELTWNNHGSHFDAELDVDYANIELDVGTLRTRAYRDPNNGCGYTVPGPTMKLVPGQEYVIRFRNYMPFSPPSSDVNSLKDPDITNLHTHGLHIKPSQAPMVTGGALGDHVMVSFEGGTGGDYCYEIPPDHMGGTHWYHAHHHGSTTLHVAGGMLGMIIMSDDYDAGIPSSVRDMQGLTHELEKHLVIAYIDTSIAGKYSDPQLGGIGPTWTVNGKVNGNLCMRENDWEYWRVLLADQDAAHKDLIFGNECEVVLLARDGVWRTDGPKELTTKSIKLTAASRADFAVRCTADSTLKVGNQVVANIVADSSLPLIGGSAPFDYNWKVDPRPNYLRDLWNEPAVSIDPMSLGARRINGELFDEHFPLYSWDCNSGIHELSLSANAHPFHMHVDHVQTMGCGGDYEDGERYDTVQGNCQVRFELDSSFSPTGPYILHCHILEHEDQGGMGWLDIHGDCGTEPDYPGGTSAYCFKFDLNEGCCVPSPEICDDGIDNDCDALVDCADPDCSADPVCGSKTGTEIHCDDGVDNDGDGYIDCADPDCNTDPACTCAGAPCRKNTDCCSGRVCSGSGNTKVCA